MNSLFFGSMGGATKLLRRIASDTSVAPVLDRFIRNSSLVHLSTGKHKSNKGVASVALNKSLVKLAGSLALSRWHHVASGVEPHFSFKGLKEAIRTSSRQKQGGKRPEVWSCVKCLGVFNLVPQWSKTGAGHKTISLYQFVFFDLHPWGIYLFVLTSLHWLMFVAWTPVSTQI